MEQHLLQRAVVHWEDTQTAVIIVNDFVDFIPTIISSAIMNAILRSILCSKCCFTWKQVMEI